MRLGATRSNICPVRIWSRNKVPKIDLFLISDYARSPFLWARSPFLKVNPAVAGRVISLRHQSTSLTFVAWLIRSRFPLCPSKKALHRELSEKLFGHSV